MTLHNQIYWIIKVFFLLTGLTFAEGHSLKEDKSAVCITCHGFNGISSNSLIPSLAGQNADYIVSQLKAFRLGLRKNEIMQEISTSLTEYEMQGLANFFSNQVFESIPVNGKLLEQGKAMYSQCWGCHGEQGEGPGSYPRIAGQHPHYIVQQLNNFKNGLRNNPVMRAIIAELTPEEMEALGTYIGSFKP